MNNNWEYDYSSLYSGSGQSEPQPRQEPGEPAPRRSGGAKRVLASVLLVAFCFASGFGGSYLANQMNTAQAPQGPTVNMAPAPDTGSEGGSAPEGAAQSTNMALTGAIEQIAQKVQPSVVEITTESVVTSNYFFGQQYVQSGAGSGVIISEDGYIITNDHVVSDAQQITVRLTDGTEYDAKIIGTDSRSDIAVIKIEASGLSPATIGDSDRLQVGEFAMAVGNPLGNFGGSVTDGIISGLNRSISVNNYTMQVVQTNAAISPGNSGGGLFNERGELIAIVNAKSAQTNAEGLGFAIPINTAISVAKDLIENGYVSGRPQMGVMVISVNDIQTAYQYGVSQLGVYVQSVNEGSAAEAAGLQPGDRFIAIDDTVISSNADITNVLGSHAIGDEISIQVARGAQIVTLRLTLEESKGQTAPQPKEN